MCCGNAKINRRVSCTILAKKQTERKKEGGRETQKKIQKESWNWFLRDHWKMESFCFLLAKILQFRCFFMIKCFILGECQQQILKNIKKIKFNFYPLLFVYPLNRYTLKTLQQNLCWVQVIHKCKQRNKQTKTIEPRSLSGIKDAKS